MNKINRNLIDCLDSILPNISIKKKNVLFIDDDERQLSTYKAGCRKDANVFLSKSYDEAIDVIESNDIDIVFCDYKMPNMNGAEMLELIQHKYPNIRRVALTGYYSNSIVKEFKDKSNTTDIIHKPCFIDDIISFIFSYRVA